MNMLPIAKRAAVIRGLVEGGSIRSVARMTGVDKDTVSRLLVEVGEFCSTYQHHVLTKLPCERIECDEIWSLSMPPDHANGQETIHTADQCLLQEGRQP